MWTVMKRLRDWIPRGLGRADRWRAMAYLVLDSCRGVVETNSAHRVKERGSPLLALGGNGGGEAFAIDLQTGEWVMVNFVDLGSGEHEFRFANLRALLDAFAAGTAFDR